MYKTAVGCKSIPVGRLLDNPHFQKFASNFALPLINLASFASGEGEAVELGNIGVNAFKSAPDGSFYSVAFEMKLASTSYSGVYRGVHFLEANKALSTAMAADERFACAMSELGIKIPTSPAGSIEGKSPVNWV